MRRILMVFLNLSCISGCMAALGSPPSGKICSWSSPLSIECIVADATSEAKQIPLQISLRNVSTLAVSGPMGWSPVDHLFIFLMKDGRWVPPTVNYQRAAAESVRDVRDNGFVFELVNGCVPTNLPPGQRTTYSFDLLRKFNLADPGRYVVVVEDRFERRDKKEDVFLVGSASFCIGPFISEKSYWPHQAD